MTKHTLQFKIEKLNKACDGGLDITHYSDWQVTSYKMETFLYGKCARAVTIVGAVNKAWREYLKVKP